MPFYKHFVPKQIGGQIPRFLLLLIVLAISIRHPIDGAELFMQFLVRLARQWNASKITRVSNGPALLEECSMLKLALLCEVKIYYELKFIENDFIDHITPTLCPFYWALTFI